MSASLFYKIVNPVFGYCVLCLTGCLLQKDRLMDSGISGALPPPPSKVFDAFEGLDPELLFMKKQNLLIPIDTTSSCGWCGARMAQAFETDVVNMSWDGSFRSTMGCSVRKYLQDGIERFVRSNALEIVYIVGRLTDRKDESPGYTRIYYKADEINGYIQMWIFPFDEKLSRIGFAVNLVEQAVVPVPPPKNPIPLKNE